MRKEIVVCDFCQREDIDRAAEKCCCICGKDYCPKHADYIGILVSGRHPLGVRADLEVCPDCFGLLSFDNWTTGEVSTRASEFDRPIIKMVLPSAIEAVKQSLIEIRHRIGPDDVRAWISKRKGGEKG